MKNTIILAAVVALVTSIAMSVLVYTVGGWWGVAIILIVAFISFVPTAKLCFKLWKEEKGGRR